MEQVWSLTFVLTMNQVLNFDDETGFEADAGAEDETGSEADAGAEDGTGFGAHTLFDHQ